MSGRFERLSGENPSPGAIVVSIAIAVGLAMTIGGLLFLPLGLDPLHAYAELFVDGFASWRGVGFTLVKASPLILVGLATIVAWRTGFAYLGFEGCMLAGSVASAWLALEYLPGNALAGLPAWSFWIAVIPLAFVTGALWAGSTGWLRARYGGNEALISLMMNYLAIFVVQYLVSGPMRAPGGLPESRRLPQETWLPFIIPGTRAHAGILLAALAALVVWFAFKKTVFGFELVVTGLNARASRYGGVRVERRQIVAACLSGGLAALGGLVNVLGVQHRLVDGMADGTGFIGMVAALLGQLHGLGTVIAAVLYAGMGTGADVMQRELGVPSSIVSIVQALIVLFVLAAEVLRRYRFRRDPSTGASS